jgi:hypothetical protein
MRPSLWLRFALPVLLFLGHAGPAARAADEKAESVGKLIVPVGLDADDVKNAIALSFAGRGWTIVEKTGSRVVGHINHRGIESILTVESGTKELTLYCVGWNVNKAGERKKPEIPKGWVENIKKDVTKRMNATAAKK